MEQKNTYYERNKVERRAYQRAYYLANRKAILRKMQLWSELDPEKAAKVRAYQRKYYTKNREAILAQKRERYGESKSGIRKDIPVGM
jgi:hypothetical protein